MALTTEQWAAVRKIVYGLVALAGVGLTAFGVINAEQWASISAGATGVIGAVLALLNVSPTQYKEQQGSGSAAAPAATDPNTDDYASSEYAGQ